VLSCHDTVPICPINVRQHSSAIITDGFVENQIDHRGKSWKLYIIFLKLILLLNLIN
jgi:hypothetical protein